MKKNKNNVHCEGLVKQNKTREEQDKLFQPQQQEEVKSQEEPSLFFTWLARSRDEFQPTGKRF